MGIYAEWNDGESDSFTVGATYEVLDITFHDWLNGYMFEVINDEGYRCSVDAKSFLITRDQWDKFFNELERLKGNTI